MSICCMRSCSLVFEGHFRSQAQALPERLQPEGDTSFHGQLLPKVCRFYQRKQNKTHPMKTQTKPQTNKTKTNQTTKTQTPT